MSSTRLEAFTDAVIAIIMTIMVLELHAPEEPTLAALVPLLPEFMSYVLSFTYLGIYWGNHHHLFQSVDVVNGPVLLANLHLLFWLSLVPFVTSWLGSSGAQPGPVALYGLINVGAAAAYFVLLRRLIALHGPTSRVAIAVGRDRKGTVSLAGFAAGLSLSYIMPKAALLFYVAVVLWWLIPDRRFEGGDDLGEGPFDA